MEDDFPSVFPPCVFVRPTSEWTNLQVDQAGKTKKPGGVASLWVKRAGL